jgi:hypothetical protein
MSDSLIHYSDPQLHPGSCMPSDSNENIENNDNNAFILQCIRNARNNVSIQQDNNNINDTESTSSSKRTKTDHTIDTDNKNHQSIQGILKVSKYSKPMHPNVAFIIANNDNDWLSRYNISALHNPYNDTQRAKYIRFVHDEISHDHRQQFSLMIVNDTRGESETAMHNHDISHPTSQSKKRPRVQNNQNNENMLNNIKENLHSRAERKITRIASWNVNNGFDHLALATLMAKNDIDILAIQEPRISTSPKDDVWISNMRKELRKCKYELLTS